MDNRKEFSRIADAERRLEEAERRLAAGKFSDLTDWERVRAAQSELAAARGEEYVVPRDLGVVPEAAVSGAVLLQNERRAILTFNAMQRGADGRAHDAGTAVVELVRCSLTKFGHPNDEALRGHPLATRGLAAYGVYEVRDSRWVRSMTEVNRVAFPDTPDSTQRHFVFTFHDSTFECIAHDLRMTLDRRPYAEVFADFGARVLAG